MAIGFRRTACCLVVLLALAAFAQCQSFAQDYPNRPIRLIVGGPAGGVADIRARWVAERLNAALGKSIVVDNRAGAGGNIGAELAAKSPRDGYTLIIVHQGTLALNPHIYKRVGYDPIADFTPVTRFVVSPLMLAAHPAMPVKNAGELIELVRKKPGQYNYGSPGSGTPPHLAAELFKRMAKIEVTHIPYKGGVLALSDLAAGRLTYTIEGLALQTPYAKAGRIRALGVTSAKRVASLPEIPTIAESGLPQYEYMGWMGFAAPAGTPREIVGRLNAVMVKILKTPEAREWFAEQGGEPVGDTPEEFAAFVKREHAYWGPIIRDAGIRAD
jgi:tripartite-type tricarboxylate transporter receptor subunit TctC